MATITLRQSNVVFSTGNVIKNSPLTNAEVDNNFANLNIAIASVTYSVGTSGNVLTSNGTAWLSQGLPASGLSYVTKSANYTLQNNEGVLSNTALGSFTVTLPATPSAGYQVVVADSFGTWASNNLIIARNGSTIENLAQDLVCDINGSSLQMVYNGSTWDVFATTGVTGGTGVTLTGIETLTNKTLTSATLTGTTQGITAANGTSNAMVATTAFVNNQIQNSPNIQTPIVNNIKIGYTSTATAGGTTTLDAQSNYTQIFTGSSGQTVVLPVTSTLVVGQSYHIENQGSGTLTVQSSGGNTVVTVPQYFTVEVTCIGTSLTTAADWDWDYISFSGVLGSGNVVLGSNATITLPTINYAQLVNPTLVSAFELANVRNEAPPTTVNVDMLDRNGSLIFFTSNTTANITVNLRGNASTTLDSWLGSTASNANVATAVMLVIHGTTQYYVNNVLIDGRIMHNSSIKGNLFWQGNTLSSGGTGTAMDAYGFTVIKNGGTRGGSSYGGNVFTILGSQTSFKSFLA